MTTISIHALRKESDNKVSDIAIWDNKFLSTLSARRATVRYPWTPLSSTISIHALRKESDRHRPRRC